MLIVTRAGAACESGFARKASTISWLLFLTLTLLFFLIACKDLIRRFLTFNREQRITLDEALNHEWLRKGFDGPVKPVVFPNYPREEEMDKNILRHMTEKMDFNQKEVIDAVTLNRYIRGLILCRNSARVSLEFGIFTRYYRWLLTGFTQRRYYSVNSLSSGRCNKVFQGSSLSKPETYELKPRFRPVHKRIWSLFKISNKSCIRMQGQIKNKNIQPIISLPGYEPPSSLHWN